MTPNLGQGACCALKDVFVLVKKLIGAINLMTLMSKKLLNRALKEK